MAKETLEVIKEASMTNNCPECFNQDLTLFFYQRHLYSKLYHRTTSEVRHQINCNTCGSVIYPVKWTEDIERIFDYYQKTVEPQRTKIRFTGLFYGILLGVAILIAGLFYLYSQGIIQV